MRVDELNLIGIDRPDSGVLRAEVQIRYHHSAAPATITLEEDSAHVLFDEPQSAVAPGQGAAFYQGERLVGGGWIQSSVPI